MPVDRQVTILGSGRSGSYVLLIACHQPIDVVFGRFNHAQPIHIPVGNLIYIGSAMGGRLGSRLMRHATRTDGSSHPVRSQLQTTLNQHDIPAKIPTHKKLHWHVDYLLEHDSAELIGVIALCSKQRHETQIAAILAADPQTEIIAPRLGASDTRGSHLRCVNADQTWWKILPERLATALAIH
jgi:Uri superfamily endonuclease